MSATQPETGVSRGLHLLVTRKLIGRPRQTTNSWEGEGSPYVIELELKLSPT